MKKISRTLAIALVTGVALIAPMKQADAFWWGPWGGGPWGGPWYGGGPWGGPWGGYPHYGGPWGGYPYYGGPWGGYPAYGAYPGWGYPVASPYLYVPQSTASTSSTK